MYIGRISGTVVATIKNELFEGRKLLIVDRLDLDGKPTPKYDIAVDMVQAGIGDLVLVLDEGNSARQIVDHEPLGGGGGHPRRGDHLGPRPGSRGTADLP